MRVLSAVARMECASYVRAKRSDRLLFTLSSATAACEAVQMRGSRTHPPRSLPNKALRIFFAESSCNLSPRDVVYYYIVTHRLVEPAMILDIHRESPVPVYDQIVAQVTFAVASGILEPGSM